MGWMRRNALRRASAGLLNVHLVLLVGVALLAVGCASEANVTGSNSPGTATPFSATFAQSPTTPTVTPYVKPGLVPAKVTRVVDGDTIHVEIEGKDYRLRYLGMDTPETVDPRRPVGCFGEEARDRNRQFVDGRMVGLERDVSETDSFGRLLRYVWVEDRMINAALVEEGYALASTYPPDVRYSGLFASLQVQAREGQRGLWGPACGGAVSPR
ncbi:MAG: nuclease [Chloroflexi bacterium]|nr:MAG: nuclease [Chloroflexota bacterium]